MAKNSKQQMEDLVDRNLLISDAAREYLRHECWSPIVAALLLSGIRPSTRWIDVPPAETHRDDKPISHRDLFVDLHSAAKEPERGLDNEQVPHSSPRFKAAEHILLFWDQVCSEHNDYPIDLPPRDFVVWLWGQNRQGHVHVSDSSWLDTFVDSYPLKNFHKVVPREVLRWLTASSKKAWRLSPKHQFGREIAVARSEAQQAGDPSDDPDEILSRLAEMMRKGEISGVQLLSYSRKSDIRYRIEGTKGIRALRRDSFARQLRRMIAKESEATKPANSPDSSDRYFSQIKPVSISPGIVNKFTSDEQLTELARDLLRETISYVRLAASIRNSDDGWHRDVAIPIGNMARLSKLLISVDLLAAFKQKEMLALTISLAIETLINLRYLTTSNDEKLLDSYVGTPARNRSKAGADWSDLDLKQKAEATGFGDVYTHVLHDAPLHLHGSWKDLTQYHLNRVGDDRYSVKLTSREPNPRPLITLSIHSTIVINDFCNAIPNAPATESLKNGLNDLYRRLRIAEDEFKKMLSERW